MALNVLVSLSVLGLAGRAHGAGIWATPHDSFSSSIGVLGCKINTDRVAYWPGSVDCNNICVKLSHGGRSVHLLRIDQSGGAHDISYDAWNYLQTGKSAATDPIAGGPVAMDYEEVDASECASLIHTPGSKLPLSAANSINFLSSCLAQPNSWIAKNHVLYNICDSICTLGHDEECHLDLAVSNQPSCPHTLGLTSKLSSAPVYNILYQTGKTVVAGTGEVATAKAKTPAPAPVDNVPEKPAASPSPVAPSPAAPSPAPPSAAPSASPSVAVFKEDDDVRRPKAVPSASSAAQPPAAAASDWAAPSSSLSVASPSSPSAPSAPTWTGSAPASSQNGTVPSYGKPPGPSTTFAVVVSSTVPAGAPDATRTVITSAGSSAARSSLAAAAAGAVACLLLVLS